jgi:predicted metal-dependent phosphoesterase TrpH
VIEAVNNAGGCVVVSHPFKGYKRSFRAEVAKLRGLAAWEGFNGQVSYEFPFNNREARDLARKLRRRTTGGSDAHDARDLGLAYTLFPRRFSSDRELVRALRSGGYRAILDEKRAERYRVWRRERFSALDKLVGGVSLLGSDSGDPLAAAHRAAASPRSPRTVLSPYVFEGRAASWTTGVDADEEDATEFPPEHFLDD